MSRETTDSRDDDGRRGAGRRTAATGADRLGDPAGRGGGADRPGGHAGDGAARLDSRDAARVATRDRRGGAAGRADRVLDVRPGREWSGLRSWRTWRRGRGGGTAGGLAAGCSAAWRPAWPAWSALVVLELGSAAWRGWMHRLPALPATFEPSPPDEYRILVLGGSSALGEPYRPWLSRRPDRRLAAPGSGPGAAVRMRDPRLAGRLAGEAASEAGRHPPTPGRRDHLLGAQRVRGPFRERPRGARPGDRRGTPELAAPPGVSRQLALAVLPPGLRDDQQEPAGRAADGRPAPAHRPALMQPVGGGRHPGRLPSAARGDRRPIASGSAPCRS